jgi:hypothetical protein
VPRRWPRLLHTQIGDKGGDSNPTTGSTAKKRADLILKTGPAANKGTDLQMKKVLAVLYTTEKKPPAKLQGRNFPANAKHRTET